MPGFRSLLILLAAFSLTLPAAVAAPAHSPPRRIVSLNLCTDQLLIALADPAQIAALSPLARDPALSFYAARAHALPVTDGSMEELLALQPDLILAPPGRISQGLAGLSRRRVATVDIDDATRLDDIFGNIRAMAKAIGYPARAEALIARMQRDIGRLQAAPSGRGRTAAYYQRRGYLTGQGTLIDDLMTKAGLLNLSVKLGRPALSAIALEEMVAAQPDFLIMDSEARFVVDRGTELLRHPALDNAVPQSQRLYLPAKLTVCGGPSYASALAVLRAQIAAADKRQGSDIRAAGGGR